MTHQQRTPHSRLVLATRSMAKRIVAKRLVALGAAIAGLTTVGIAAAPMAFAAPAGDSSCVANTQLQTFATAGSPFSTGTRFSWKVNRGCESVVVSMDRTRSHTASGSTTVNPAVTTAYELAAVSGSARRVLTTGVALGGRVVEYRQQPGLIGSTAAEPFSSTATAARTIADRIAGQVRDKQKRNLLGKSLEVHIVPEPLELTQLPPWSQLRDKSTCTATDNTMIPGCVSDRFWNDVRGAGGTAVGADRIAVAAGAETLVSMASQWPFNGLPGHLLAHEFSHVFGQFASPGYRHLLQGTLDARGTTASYVGRDEYTRSTIDEYFAEGSAALFGYARSSADRHEYSETWLAQNDPALLGLLREIYK